MKMDSELINIIKKDIGIEFRARRYARNISTYKLYKLAGKKNSATIHAIEKGRDYTINSLISFLCLIEEERERPTNIIYKSVNKLSYKKRALIIQRIIADHLRLNPQVITSKIRDIELVKARYYGFKIMKEHLGMPLTEIGRMYNRGHATVISGLGEISDWEVTHNKLFKDYNDILIKVKESLGLK